MADNVGVTEGSDRAIATDEVGSVNYQRIKLTDGTPDSADHIKGDSTYGLDADVTRSVLPTGASTEATVAGIKTGTDKIPASPAQEHSTAVSPSSVRLTDGTSFYKATNVTDTQPVSATALPLPTGAATSANQTTTLTDLGAVTETAPATDTASSGLNGRLQRIAQRLTSLIALLPSSIGRKATAGSLSVTLASDEDLLSRIPSSLGQKTAAGSLAVVLPSDQNVTVQNATFNFVPALTRVTYTLTRPSNTTRYPAWTVLADSTTAATQPSITAAPSANGSGVLRLLTVWESSQALPHNFRIRVYFFSANPGAINDRTAFTIGSVLPDFHIDMPPFSQSSASASRPVSSSPEIQIPYITDASSLLYFTPVVLHDKTPITADVFTFVFYLNRA